MPATDATALAVTYQAERLSDALWDELMPLLRLHYTEIAHYDDIPLDPHREKYQQIQDVGMLRVYTARTADWALVGYVCYFVSPNLHYRSAVMANQDVLFVTPEHRGTRTGFGLLRFSHECLRVEGVKVVMQHVKHRMDINAGPLMQRMGYEHVDDIWAKRLDRSK